MDGVSTSSISEDQCWRIVAFLIWGRSHKRDIVEAVTEQEATTGVNDAYRWLHWQEHSCQKGSRLGLTSEGQVWEGPVCYTTAVPDPDADNSSMHPQSTDHSLGRAHETNQTEAESPPSPLSLQGPPGNTGSSEAHGEGGISHSLHGARIL